MPIVGVMKRRFFRTLRSDRVPLIRSSRSRLDPIAFPDGRLSAILMMTLLLAASLPSGQATANRSWLGRARQTRSHQPDWVTPLIIASANLEKAVLYNTSRKLQANSTSQPAFSAMRSL